MDQAGEKRAGRQRYRAGANAAAVGEFHAHDAAFTCEKIVDFGLDDLEVRRLRDRRLHRRGVKLAIRLRARAAHRRAFPSIEHAKLNPGAIRNPAHQAIERVDFAHEMALAEAADRRIARHRADAGELMRNQRRARAEARGRRRRLASRVASADDDHVECPHSSPLRMQAVY